MRLSVLSLFVLTLCVFVKASELAINGIKPEDLANKEGFILQKYTVKTKDDYHISLWRFNDANDTLTKDELSERTPVLAIHGILDTGTFPMYNYRNNSLAYVLYDAGYDVWTLSARGTTFSTEHKTLSIEDEEYWQYSLSEIGKYDIPAAIDFILNENTQHSSVFLLGHSMGTSSIQALMTSLDSWEFDKNKIRGIAMLAPAIYLENCSSIVIKSLLKQSESKLFKEVEKLFGTKSVLPHTGIINELPEICYNQPHLCLEVLNGIAGTNPDSTSIDENRMYVYMNFYPAGSSVHAIKHLIEIAKRNEFADFDYGSSENKEHYNTTSYPKFDANNFPTDIPLYIFYGGHDALIVKEDVENFINEMKNVGLDDFRYKMIDNYTHADFIFGMHAREDFINDVVEFFGDYN